MLSTGFCAQTACVWEATARKPGNVHRACDFADLTYVDFLLSAAAVAPVLDAAEQRPVGEMVLEAVRATRRVVQTNTNLGILLLLAPLAVVPRAEPLRPSMARVLASLDVTDARRVYEAIRLAVPGGLGRVAEQDVHGEPTQTLRQVMELAAERDLVARQYAGGFAEVFDDGLPALAEELTRGAPLEQAIVFCHLGLLARHPDSLIVRKFGHETARRVSDRARTFLEQDWPEPSRRWTGLAELDSWLRQHQFNPGTTADLVTACLFAALRDGMIRLPLRIPWAAGF